MNKLIRFAKAFSLIFDIRRWIPKTQEGRKKMVRAIVVSMVIIGAVVTLVAWIG